MKLTNFTTFISFLILATLVYLSFKTLMPSKISDASTPETEFSSDRALKQLKVISEKPHYIGSDAHAEVREYLVSQLEILGLEPHVQKGFTLNKNWRVLAKPKNILARIPGSGQGKALMLLAHYDSAPHSKSYGASDAGSGVVAILEGLRAYLASRQVPQNDIIILFSDAEEIGLMGAKLFVKEHPWVNDVGVVVNFEARGSGGPSNMILETNQGNATLVKEFVKANPSHPVASSLMYSVYKMLPNDTDSTIFRELADIDSYFFAFIDDHFDYHTANDTYENLDRNTLEHQGSYVTAVLNHFTSSDLTDLKADEDFIYFNVPFLKMVTYPFSWIIPMLILGWMLFAGLILYGISRQTLNRSEMLKGFVPFLLALVVSGLLAFLGWKLLLKTYAGYGEIQHGFTYNGHLYIAAFVLLSLAITFFFYRRFHHREAPANLVVAPLFFWLIICTLISVYLRGGAFFIIPVYFSLAMLFVLIRFSQPPALAFLFLSAPAIFILTPLIQFFPVGLGLKMLVAGAALTVLLFGLLLPLLGAFRMKRTLSILFLGISLLFFVIAHMKSDFTEDRNKPNSLVYYHDADKKESHWVTYDNLLDDWTKNYIGESPVDASTVIQNVTGSKYGTSFSYAASGPEKTIPEPEILLIKDSIQGDMRAISLLITPQRMINMITLFADKEAVFKDFIVNGMAVPKDESSGSAYDSRLSNLLLNYYVSDKDSLEISYTIPYDSEVLLTLLESSFDLLENSAFTIPERSEIEIPKPFVVTDAVVLQKTIDINTMRRQNNTSRNDGENGTN
ncbi:MAG: M20/M25/M40 family metallo-hydrolase [Flavobacteriaceae bacterium]